MQVTVRQNFGPFKPGNRYSVCGDGGDYIKLKHRGVPYCVPRENIDYREPAPVTPDEDYDFDDYSEYDY
jgi:hypothetical protein